ncbi:MAG: hypothetical protein CMP22_01470 [Rickettsiales bacterium]|nr:hypothetical protein [Rickettsiales bacterium]
MLKIYPKEQLGHAKYSWLNTRYHFSFSNYYNPTRMNFGSLRVINDDIIAAKTGFDPHPHDNMEIITYVRKGAITHKDSMGNEGKTNAGDVQVMSAGTGVVHAEYNLEDEDTILYQIWITPKKRDVEPRWEQREFPKDFVDDKLKLIVSGQEDSDGIYIHQDAEIYAGRIKSGNQIKHNLKAPAYILISEGEVTLNDQTLKAGDGAEVFEIDTLNIDSKQDCEILVIEIADAA